MLDQLFTPQVIEERINEEESRLNQLSTETLRYMYDHGLAWAGWLRHHRVNLLCRAEEEYDLFEAIRLSARLSNVEANLARTGSKNEKLRARLIGRSREE